jgi:hypothetical protein
MKSYGGDENTDIIRKITLFLGAGASASFGYPTVNFLSYLNKAKSDS